MEYQKERGSGSGGSAEPPESEALLQVCQHKVIHDDLQPGDYDCGLGSWKPSWLQGFANSKSFMFVYGMLGTVQAMSFVYFIGTLTTIEKRFGIQSKTTGLMLSGNEVSQILLSPILSYYGGSKNRPVWIAWGVAFSALSCYVLASPHFIFGPGLNSLLYTREYGSLSDGHNHTLAMRKESASLCTSESKPDTCSSTEDTYFAPILIFLSQFILGIGTTLYYSLGQPYIDDNSKKANTPFLLGLTMALRTIGPSFGFLVTYLCLSLYIDPSLTPTINSKDPRWLGAWWLGWIILGTVMLLQAFLISLFPRKLRKKQKEEKEKPKLEGPAVITSEKPVEKANGAGPITNSIHHSMEKRTFMTSLMKLLKNKILIVNIFSGVFYVLGGSGYMTFMTKNMEVQWYQSSASANIFIGPIVIGSMVGGFIISGWVISKYKPRPTILLGWNVFVGMMYVISELIFIFLACPENKIVGYNSDTKSLSFVNNCNEGCGCENVNFSPVCLTDLGLTFFSPCHAGCKAIVTKGMTSMYTNCTCVPKLTSVTIQGLDDAELQSYGYESYLGPAKSGYCTQGCWDRQSIYFLMSLVMHFLGSSGKIGNILVNFRSIDPDDKSFSTGLSLFLISLIAFIPGPILFGYIIDASCIYYDNTCGKEGTCSFYDRDNFRLYLNGTAAVITSIGVILDAFVCYLGRNLELYDEEETSKPLAERKSSISSEKLKAKKHHT